MGVVQEGNQIMAMIGKDLAVGRAGFGNTIPAALRDLAAALDKEGILLGPLGGASCALSRPPPE